MVSSDQSQSAASIYIEMVEQSIRPNEYLTLDMTFQKLSLNSELIVEVLTDIREFSTTSRCWHRSTSLSVQSCDGSSPAFIGDISSFANDVTIEQWVSGRPNERSIQDYNISEQ